MKQLNMKLLTLVTAALFASPVWSQSGMDHSGHDMHSGSMPDSSMKKPAEMPQKDTQKNMGSMEQSSGAMDHGEMNMQGGPAPADARDPHAYSGGHTLESGPYALPGGRQLRLADEQYFPSLLVDRLEAVRAPGNTSSAYDFQARIGKDYDRLVVKAEGAVDAGKVQEASTELLWGHSIATFWDTQLGVRYDSGTGPGPDRGWLAFGVQGLAPYWFEVDATAYVGNNGRTAVGIQAEYELLLTQKLVLQPRIEASWYGKTDEPREIGRGLAEGSAGLRLRYEITRQFAPYFGVERVAKFGKTAEFAREAGEKTSDTRWVAGVRFWF